MNVLGGGSANRNDLFLAPNQSAHTNAGIEHPLPIVFVRDVKGSEIVDGGDNRTRLLPNQAPVARHMEDIEMQLAGQGWHNRLMPEDVFDRRPKLFRNGNDAGLIASKIE